MTLKDKLTCESLAKKFKSPFELANYAMKVARNMLETGRRSKINVGIDNPARMALEEIEADVVEFAVIEENGAADAVKEIKPINFEEDDDDSI